MALPLISLRRAKLDPIPPVNQPGCEVLELSLDIINSISVQCQGKTSFVDLVVGDLSAISEPQAVDLLVVSAFPDDYSPTPSSLIGALDARGISLSSLAENKAVDLRQFSSCWLSQVIDTPSVNFTRVLCFEPAFRGQAAEVAGDIFRSIIPFTTGDPPISSIAMPLVAAGDQGEKPEVMLVALVDAAIHWLKAGMPIDRIKIVVPPSADLTALKQQFGTINDEHANPVGAPTGFAFDVFFSYCWSDKEVVDVLVSKLVEKRPELRVFVDRLELKTGAAWQQHIFESLEASRKVVCIYSPAYLNSKVCKEEFNMALLKNRESSETVLLPVYLNTAELPLYMKLIQYFDAREGDAESIEKSFEALLQTI